MKFKSIIYNTVFVCLLLIAVNISSQVNLQQNFSLTHLKLKSTTSGSKFAELPRKTSTVLPISIGVLTAIYLLNPMVEYTDRKVYAGLTKEVSVGFGKLGEHRTAFEYSMVFGGSIRHYIRLSYKYDILLADGIEPSHMLQGTSVVSVGAGYFTDFKGKGIFPEITYGYSIRNHRLLFYPHIKLRYTYMLTKDKPSITDLSFGVILGIANPFLDVDIKRRY
ncbi:MAG TPA: hypothetical protein PKE39_01835 [Ignavibacteria bacterium]|nr:hypothetical protein [Ignavibacteria bacterium]HMQ97740.1 hypothetical protein [Ignavibacteria bacterium]